MNFFRYLRYSENYRLIIEQRLVGLASSTQDIDLIEIKLDR